MATIYGLTPSGNDYKRAAAVLDYFIKSGRSYVNLFRIYAPNKPSRRCFNIFRKDNYNWGEKEVAVWENIIRLHHKEHDQNKSKELHSIKSKRLGRKRNRARTLLMINSKKRYEDVSRLSDMAASIKDTVKSCGYTKPRDCAAFMAHLFVVYEPENQIRHRELRAIFAGKVSPRHHDYITIMWDYTRKGVMDAWSIKKIKKYGVLE